MDTFFSAQTYGLLFNDRLSAVLKVPLLSTSLRSHLNAKILEQKTHEHLHWVQRILDALGDEAPVRQVTTPSVIHGAAPFLLQTTTNGGNDMERRIVNPWTWQDAFGYVQGNEIAGARRVLICAGQLATDADGHLLHVRDMRGQIGQSLDNLETVLKSAGMGLADVVRLNFYTTDVDALMEAMADFGGRLTAANCRPASTLLGVSRLVYPDQLVELEATACA